MKVRRRSLVVPTIAILGILLALYLLSRRKAAEPLPAEISVSAAPAPKPAAHDALPAPPAPSPEPGRASPISAPPAAALPAPSDAEYHMSVEMEMKVAMAAIYSAEKSFYSEYRRYSTDLNALGYFPEMRLPLRVKVGFLHEYVPPDPLPTEIPGKMTLSTEGFQDKGLRFTPQAQAARLEDAARYCHYGCTASDSRFELVVVTTVNGKPDVWTITQDKVMTHETQISP